MQLAAAEERYTDAAALRNQIERIMSSDRCLSLIVAMESALDDGRLEEAARLRDELRMQRQGMPGPPQVGGGVRELSQDL